MEEKNSSQFTFGYNSLVYDPNPGTFIILSFLFRNNRFMLMKWPSEIFKAAQNEKKYEKTTFH